MGTCFCKVWRVYGQLWGDIESVLLTSLTTCRDFLPLPALESLSRQPICIMCVCVCVCVELCVCVCTAELLQYIKAELLQYSTAELLQYSTAELLQYITAEVLQYRGGTAVQYSGATAVHYSRATAVQYSGAELYYTAVPPLYCSRERFWLPQVITLPLSDYFCGFNGGTTF